MKKVPELATCTVNSNSKHDRIAMAESDKPNRPANTVEPRE